MCPDGELNPQPFAVTGWLQPTDPPRQGQRGFLMENKDPLWGRNMPGLNGYKTKGHFWLLIITRSEEESSKSNLHPILQMSRWAITISKCYFLYVALFPPYLKYYFLYLCFGPFQNYLLPGQIVPKGNYDDNYSCGYNVLKTEEHLLCGFHHHMCRLRLGSGCHVGRASGG